MLESVPLITLYYISYYLSLLFAPGSGLGEDFSGELTWDWDLTRIGVWDWIGGGFWKKTGLGLGSDPNLRLGLDWGCFLEGNGSGIGI